MKPAFSGSSGRLLEAAAAAIAAVDSGRVTLDDRLDAAGSGLRRSLSHLLLTFYRRRRFIDARIAELAAHRPAPEVRRLLEAALTQIHFQSAIAPESAVNVAVETAAAAAGRRAAGFVNAVLRRAVRERPMAQETPEQVLPPPVLRRWRRIFNSAELAQLTAAFLTEPEFTFRMEHQFMPGFDCDAIPSPGRYRFFRAAPEAVLNSEDFRLGRLYIQDPAASLAPSLDDLRGVRRALDLCAAPGGKSLMLSEALPGGAELVAADRSEARQRLTAANFRLRGLQHRIVTAAPEILTGEFDYILADVPCSNTGVFRRRPDALWRFSDSGLAEIGKLQEHILAEAARLTAPGGRLIYSTCSIDPDENELRIASFLERHPEFELTARSRLLPGPGSDGAFAARLVKQPR